LLAIAFPKASWAAVVIFTVYPVLKESAAVGVKVKTLFATSWVILPGTTVPPDETTVKSVVVIVAGFIAWVYVAVITVLGQMPVALLGGVTETGGAAGRQELAPVANVHTYLPAKLLPYMSSTPAVIVAVNVVFSGRLALGAKMAVLLAAS